MSYSVKLINKFSSFVDKSDTKRLSTQTEPEDVVKVKNIVYAGDGSDIYRLLDVYYPEGAKGKLPVIIDIHGGAWFYGTKDINRIYAQKIAREGFAVVNMSYRLLFNGGNIHTMVEDVFGVFNWIKQNEDNYPFDLKNVFLTGDSAGAHIACLALSVMADEELQQSSSFSMSSMEMLAMGGFALFGKNVLNVWPVLLRAFLYARVRGEAFAPGRTTQLGRNRPIEPAKVPAVGLDDNWHVFELDHGDWSLLE